jgi:uncharacterized membrane protein YfcA
VTDFSGLAPHRRDQHPVIGTLVLFLIGLPALALGTWAGLKLFGKLDDQAFRRIVLVLLLISGASLLVLGR